MTTCVLKQPVLLHASASQLQQLRTLVALRRPVRERAGDGEPRGHMRMQRTALDEDAPGLQAEVREQPPDLRKPGTHSVRPAELSPERVLTRDASTASAANCAASASSRSALISPSARRICRRTNV